MDWRLRVDASVVTITNECYAPVLMIAEKAADHCGKYAFEQIIALLSEI